MWSKRKNAPDTQPAPAGVLRFEVAGMHCGSCGLTIDEAVEDIPGVARARTSFRSGSTDVTLSEGASPEQIAGQVLIAITAVGYAVSPPARLNVRSTSTLPNTSHVKAGTRRRRHPAAQLHPSPAAGGAVSLPVRLVDPSARAPGSPSHLSPACHSREQREAPACRKGGSRAAGQGPRRPRG